LLGGTVESFIFAGILHILLVILSLSQIAEKLLRFLNGIRKLETNEEKEYLNPIFKEVINTTEKQLKGKNSWLHKIDICVIDQMSVNACAIGSRTIAVTKGAMKAFSNEQLKGVIAHELNLN